MNSLTITGNLGKDAELRHTPKGDAVLTFSVADSQGKDKPSLWWSCQLWGKRAETLAQYLTKGQQVTVVGNVTEREYQAKDGTQKKAMEVKVNDLALQGARQQSQSASEPRQAAPRQASAGFDDLDTSEIPF
jgi:single-strand DNA-binding protein